MENSGQYFSFDFTKFIQRIHYSYQEINLYDLDHPYTQVDYRTALTGKTIYSWDITSSTLELLVKQMNE